MSIRAENEKECRSFKGKFESQKKENCLVRVQVESMIYAQPQYRIRYEIKLNDKNFCEIDYSDFVPRSPTEFEIERGIDVGTDPALLVKFEMRNPDMNQDVVPTKSISMFKDPCPLIVKADGKFLQVIDRPKMTRTEVVEPDQKIYIQSCGLVCHGKFTSYNHPRIARSGGN